MKNKTSCKPGMTRRQFIGAAASVTTFTIVPRHVLGGPGYSPPSETLNMGLVGAGGHGAFLINEVLSQSKGIPRNLGSVNVVAVCDVNEKRASETIIRKVPFAMGANDGGFKSSSLPNRYNGGVQRKKREFDNTTG